MQAERKKAEGGKYDRIETHWGKQRHKIPPSRVARTLSMPPALLALSHNQTGRKGKHPRMRRPADKATSEVRHVKNGTSPRNVRGVTSHLDHIASLQYSMGLLRNVRHNSPCDRRFFDIFFPTHRLTCCAVYTSPTTNDGRNSIDNLTPVEHAG